MLGQRLDRDLVLRIFVEKGFKLPSHHLTYYHQRLTESKPILATPNPAVLPVSLPEVAPKPAIDAPSSPAPSSTPVNSIPNNHRSKPSISSMINTEPMIRIGPMIPVATSAPSSLQAQNLPHSLPRPPHQPSRPSYSPLPSTPSVDLSEKEAKARQALLARKAEIARRNAEKAQAFMEAQLKGLLPDKPSFTTAGTEADAPSAMGSIPDLHDAETQSPHVTMESADMQESNMIDEFSEENLDRLLPEEAGNADNIRESEIGETREKLVTLEDAAARNLPTLDDSDILSGDRIPKMHHSLPSLPVSASSASRRPVASDFESEPTQALPNVPRWSAHLPPSARAKEFVIDLSDHEDSEDDSDTEGLRAAVTEAKHQDYPFPPSTSASTGRSSFNQSRKPPSPANDNFGGPLPSPAFELTTPTSSDAKDQLEAKQAEIARMMEMISQLEGKKKGGTRIGSRAGTPSTPATLGESAAAADTGARSPVPHPVTPLAAVPVIRDTLQTAKATVDRLLEERQELVEEVERVEVSGYGGTINLQEQQIDAVAQLQDHKDDSAGTPLSAAENEEIKADGPTRTIRENIEGGDDNMSESGSSGADHSQTGVSLDSDPVETRNGTDNKRMDTSNGKSETEVELEAEDGTISANGTL